MNHFAKACLLVLPLSLPLVEASAASSESSSNTPELINSKGCKLVITAPTWVCLDEDFDAKAILTSEDSSHDVKFPVKITGSIAARVEPKFITTCPTEVDLECKSGKGPAPGPIYITVNGIKSGPIRLVDFERPGSYSMIPTGPIQRDSTSAGTAQDYDFIANGRVGVKYAHGAADKCKAKWSTKVLVKFNGELFCYAAASGFVPGLVKHAKAAAWAKGQVGSGNAVDATASAASSESPSPLPLDLAAGPFGTTIALPVLKQGEERKPVAGFGDVDKSGEHSPNTELEITSTCIIQTGAVTQVDGGGSYAFANATLTAETVDPGSNPIIFSSSH